MIILRELVDVLEQADHLLCAPTVDLTEETHHRGRRVVLTVTFLDGDTAELSSLNLLHELEYLQALAELRALSEKFGIPSKKLEALLPPKE